MQTTTDPNPARAALRYYRIRAEGGAWTSPYTSELVSNTCSGTIVEFMASGSYSFPAGITFDAAGNLYVASFLSNRVYKVTPGGVSSVYAGTGTSGFSGDGGAATAARLSSPTDVAADPSGNLYIADSGNDRIRKVTPGGTISTVAGTGSGGYSGDGGLATSAQINGPYGIGVDGSGNVYIADTSNHRIRKVAGSGIITTVAGTGSSGFSGDGGAATSAKLSGPYAIKVASNGDLYISDTGNGRVRRVASGTITTIAGGGGNTSCSYSGAATNVSLSNPDRVAIDASGRVVIPDYGHSCIRLYDAGTIAPFAGTGSTSSSGNNGPAVAAAVDVSVGVAWSAAGDLYLSESGSGGIRRVITP
ncbi:MAG: hypothetical protein R2715_07365 [Ilumatobacteraceae bacterium]